MAYVQDRKTRITGGLSGITIDQGERPPGGFDRFMEALTTGVDKSYETRQKEEQDKTKYYISLREAGYSADEATRRVNDNYKGKWLDRILGKSSFNAPMEDPIDMREKEASIEEKQSKSNYYRSGNTYSKGVTLAQLRGERDQILDMTKKEQSLPENVRRVKFLQNKINELIGYEAPIDPKLDIPAGVDGRQPTFVDRNQEDSETKQPLRRKTRDNKIALFDPDTKEFMGYE